MLLKRQETVVFDPTNKEHRAAVRAFLKRKAWVDSPIRFAHDPIYGSVADQVQAKLLQWYADQEDAKLAIKGKKPSFKIQPNAVSFLDDLNATAVQ